MMNRINKDVVRALSIAEWECVSGGNGASNDVNEEQIETIVVDGGSFYAGSGGGLLIGTSIAHGGGNTFFGPVLGFGGSISAGYESSSADASQAADDINEGFELCLPVCVELKVKGLFTNDFSFSAGLKTGAFYGSTVLL